MTQVQVRELSDYTLSLEIFKLIYPGEDCYRLPDYCNNPTASLEVQAKAIEVSAEKYVQALQISTSVCAVMQNSRKDIAVLLTASPRERAEAAYITLSSVKE